MPGHDTEESEPKKGSPPMLDYAKPPTKLPLVTLKYPRDLLFVVSLLAIVLATPFCIGGIGMIANWLSGTVTADRSDGLRFLAVSGLLLIPGLFGLWAAIRPPPKN